MSKPITPYTVSTTDTEKRSKIFSSPKSNIKVGNLMSNGLSYPNARNIYKNYFVKPKIVARRHSPAINQPIKMTEGD